ncbi:MAG: hypothetical protein IJ575_10950 [Selenomonadaceae bacterium]|nr:hypothetical protein [Selenomonadaceae bacterium]
MKIVFSIPVHERAESVFDLIENLLTYHDDCGIVLHISQSFEISSPYFSEKSFFRILSTCEPYKSRVIINPVRWNTTRVNGGVHLFLNAHFGNFDYACEKFGDFEYFVFAASNELYFKRGAYDIMKNYDAGLDNLKYNNWTQAKLAQDDLRPRRMLRELGIPDFTISMCEGSFYKREVFKKIKDILTPWIDPKLPPTGYALEEIYLPTVARKVVPADRIYNGRFTRINLNQLATIPLVDELINLPNVFAYKRVDRYFDNKARRYLGEKIGHYRERVEKLFWIFPTPIDPVANPNVSQIVIQVSKVLFTVKLHVARGRINGEEGTHDIDALNLFFRIMNEPQITLDVWKIFVEDLFNIVRMLFIRLVLNPRSMQLKILEDLIYRKISEVYKEFSSQLETWQIEDGIMLANNTRYWKRLPPQDFEVETGKLACIMANDYLQKDQTQKALNLLTKMQSLETGLSKDFYYVLSNVYRKLNRKDDAIKAYEKSF